MQQPITIGLEREDSPQGYVENPAAWTDLLGLSAFFPGGFESKDQFDTVMSELRHAAAKDGLSDVKFGVRGSSVAGKSRKEHDFDKGEKPSDIDVFIEGMSARREVSENQPAFIHSDRIKKQYPNIKRRSKKWTKLLKRNIFVDGLNPSSPVHGKIH